MEKAQESVQEKILVQLNRLQTEILHEKNNLFIDEQSSEYWLLEQLSLFGCFLNFLSRFKRAYFVFKEFLVGLVGFSLRGST